MRSFTRTISLILLTLFTAACGNVRNAATCDFVFSDVSHTEINTDLTISTPPSINNYKIGEMVNVVADNNSKSLIEVAPDKDLKVFWWKGNSWLELAQQVNYVGKVERLSFPTNDDPGGSMYLAMFTIPTDSPAYSCIVLRGVKDPDGSPVNVGAFVEITMYP